MSDNKLPTPARLSDEEQPVLSADEASANDVSQTSAAQSSSYHSSPRTQVQPTHHDIEAGGSEQVQSWQLGEWSAASSSEQQRARPPLSSPTSARSLPLTRRAVFSSARLTVQYLRISSSERTRLTCADTQATAQQSHRVRSIQLWGAREPAAVSFRCICIQCSGLAISGQPHPYAKPFLFQVASWHKRGRLL